MADAVKQLKIKTGSVNRCMKDRTASDKEIEKQQQRIETFKADAHKDHHDVAKQEEVLAEMVAGRSDELNRLKDFMQELESIVELTKADLGSSDEHSQAQEAIDRATALLKKEGIALDD